MTKALVVMSHKGGEGAVQRHLQMWREFASPDMLIGSAPQDGTIWPDEFSFSLAHGKSEHAGQFIIHRLVELMEILLHFRHDRYCIIEYDLIILRPVDWPVPGFFSEICDSVDKRFKCQEFYLPPWIMDYQTMKEVSQSARTLLSRGDIEMGYTDRFFALACQEAGIKARHVPGGILTRDFHLQPSAYPTGRDLAKVPAVTYLHTCKTEHELQYFLGQREDAPG